MIIVQNSTKKLHGGGSYFIINGKEISLGLRQSEVKYVEQMANEVWNVIVNKDVVSYRRVLTKYHQLRVLKISVCFEAEFTNFIRFICNKHRLENKVISAANVFLELSYSSRTLGKAEFKFVSSIVQLVSTEYLTITLENIQCKNREMIWSYTRCLRKVVTAVDLVSSCISLGKPFEDYLKECVNDIDDDGSNLGWMHLLNYSLYGITNTKFIRANYLYKFFEEHGNIFKTVRRESFLSKLESIKAKKYKFSEDVWIVYVKQLEHLHRHEFDFSEFKGELKHQVKLYIQDALRSKDSTRKVISRLHHLKKCYQVLSVYPFQSFLELNAAHAHHLIDGLQQLKMENSCKRYSLTSVRGIFGEMKIFIDWLLEKYQVDKENPFKKFTFHNQKSFSKKTPYIPEEVITQMENHLGEQPDWVKNAWIIMMHSGMRVGEALSLEEDWLYYDEEEKHWLLKYIPWKTVKFREDKFLVIPAHDELVKHFNNQFENTKELRKKLDTKLIFCTEHLDRGTIHSVNTIISSINRVIKKYQIKDNMGKLFRYTNHQCRKTLTTSLFSSGATLEEVANFVGHLSISTTERAYKEIEINKLAELESEFFKKYFDEFVESEELSPYTESERKALLDEIMLGSRETPEGHGICFKHIAFGPCVKKKCAGCNFLITGPQHLPKWYQLYQEQQAVIRELEAQYKQNNIHDYEGYKSFQKNKHDLQTYRTKIIEAERAAKKVGMHIERPTDLVI